MMSIVTMETQLKILEKYSKKYRKIWKNGIENHCQKTRKNPPLSWKKEGKNTTPELLFGIKENSLEQ